MSFDFAKAEAEASAAPKANLAAVVLGQSSAGKSYLAGTLPGKTLFLYTQGEDHGKDSAYLAAAAAEGKKGKLIPLSLDVVDGAPIGADAACAAC